MQYTTATRAGSLPEIKSDSAAQGRALPGSFGRSQGRASQLPSQRALPGRLQR